MSAIRKAVNYLRQIMGETAYERYCEYLRRAGHAERIPTPQQFYLESLERRYSRPSRCC